MRHAGPRAQYGSFRRAARHERNYEDRPLRLESSNPDIDARDARVCRGQGAFTKEAPLQLDGSAEAYWLRGSGAMVRRTDIVVTVLDH